MPPLICNRCQKRLRISYDFVKLAHESEKHLKAFLIKISKDFQLVTSTTSSKDKSNKNEDDDDLLSTIIEEENIDKAEVEREETTKKSASVQKSDSENYAAVLPSKNEQNIRKNSISENRDNQEQVYSKKLKLDVDDAGDVITKETSSKLIKVNFKRDSTDKGSNEYELFEPDVQVGIEAEEAEEEEGENISKYNIKDDVNLHKLSDTEAQNQTTPEHEIQILDYTDEDSQAELEILEENLQPSDDARSSLDGIEEPTPSNDGFLKEYQTMLDESDEYLEDSNTMQVKTTKANDVHLYVVSEELLDDTEVEMRAVEETQTDRENSVDTATPQGQPITENTRTVVKQDTKGKSKRSLIKTNARSSGAKPTRKDDGTSTSKRFFCFKCNRDFTTKTNLTRHMVTHEGTRPFQCKVCSKSFSQNVSLKQHMYTHTGEKPYQCEICDRGFTQCKSLVFHLRRHTGEKPFPCEKCGALFRQKDGLKTHILKRHTIKSHHGSTELITCAICKEVFADNNSLQEHMKKHLNDYVRVDSAMSFSNRETNTDENNHMMLEFIEDDPLHDKATAFLTEPMSESTDDIKSAAHVVDLMTTSALEPSRAKKFQCRKCFKCFAIKKNLLRHLTTHDINVDTEDCLCKLCELSFTSSEELRAHTSREHNSSGELHQCELCQLVFSSAAEQHNHSHLQHAFKCVVCPSIQFTSRRLLMEHMMEHDLNEIQ